MPAAHHAAPLKGIVLAAAAIDASGGGIIRLPPVWQLRIQTEMPTKAVRLELLDTAAITRETSQSSPMTIFEPAS